MEQEKTTANTLGSKPTPIWYASLIHFFTILFWISVIDFTVLQLSGYSLRGGIVAAALGIWIGNIFAVKYINKIHQIANKSALIKLSTTYFIVIKLIELYGYFFHLRFRVTFENRPEAVGTALAVILSVIIYHYLTKRYINKIKYPVEKSWGKLHKVSVITAKAMLILLITILLIPSILNNFTRDLPLLDDSNLRLEKISIPDTNNSFFDLEKNFDLVLSNDNFSLYQNYINKGEWDEEKIKVALLEAEPAFINFDAAATKKYYQDPALADLENTDPLTLPVRPLNSLRSLARLNSLKAIDLSNNGEEKQAFEQCFRVIKVADQIENSQGTLIQYLVAIAMKQSAFETLQKISKTTTLPSQSLISYTKELKEFNNKKAGFISALKGEYWANSWMIDKLSNQGMNNFYYFRPNENKTYSYKRIIAHIEALEKPCSQSEKIKEDNFFIPWYLLFFTENAYGKLLANINTYYYDSVLEKRCKEDQSLTKTMVSMALQAYKNDIGRYPQSLNELVPNYIPEIPIDPMTGKLFEYNY